MNDIKIDNVMKALPKFPRSKQGEGKQIIESLIKASNFSSYLATLEVRPDLKLLMPAKLHVASKLLSGTEKLEEGRKTSIDQF